jgi:hypothetical protein
MKMVAPLKPPPTSTPFPSPTTNPVRATAMSFVDACGGNWSHNYRHEQVLSPNGQWAATVCEDKGLYTKVFRVDGSASWTLSPLNSEGVAVTENWEWYLMPYYWSRNGQYLYLTPIYWGAIDGPGYIFVDGFGLFRLNLYDGRLDQWLKIKMPDGYAFSFSPDEKWFLYSDPNLSKIIRVRNMISGEMDYLSFKDEYVDAGMFLWTKDSAKVLIVAGISDWVSGDGGFSLLVYDPKEKKLRILIDNDKRKLAPCYYNKEGIVAGPWLSDEVALMCNREEKYWTLNIRTGVLTDYIIATETPTATP